MDDLSDWAHLDPEGWAFGPESDHIEPWEVVVHRPIFAAGPDGPLPTGRVILRHFIDGELASTRTEWVA